MKEILREKRKLIDILVILLVASIMGAPLLISNIDVYCDDGIQHIARAFGTAQAIKNGNFLGNVISSFSNGLGYSWNLFYGPISSTAIMLVSIIVRNFIVSYKIVCFIAMILSGFFMYKFMFALINNRNASLLASILYMTFPYHLTDLYTRNALGEYMSFIFIPIVFLGLYNLFYSEDNPYYFAIGIIGLVLTHNLSTVMVGIFALIYVIFNLDKLNKSSVRKRLLINIIAIILITSFFWIPLIQTKLSTNYMVYEEGFMATTERTANSALKFRQLFVTFNDGEYVFELGLHIIVMFALSVMTFRRINEEFRGNYIFFITVSIISLWMTTKLFPWKHLPEVLSIIQFPWRFMQMSAFFLSTVCSINMYAIIKKFNYKDVIVIGVIAIIYICGFIGRVGIIENFEDIKDIELGKVSGREYETVAGAGKLEYLPKKAYDNRFYLATREEGAYVLTGKAAIDKEEKNNGKYTANIQTYDVEYSILELPYIYYPGYEVRLDGIVVDNFETDNGLLGIVLRQNDNYKISVEYKGTDAMRISFLISIISLIIFAFYVRKKY